MDHEYRLHNMPSHSVVLFSGGVDSAACAHFLQQKGQATECLFVDYGQAAAQQEQQAASALADILSSPLTVTRFRSGQNFAAGEILGRNAFLVISALMSTRLTSGLLALGIHAGTRYYDCTPAFLQSLDRLVAEYTDGQVRVTAPFIYWSKHEIFDYYVSAGLPMHIPYSCEAGTTPACGSCASCLDRRTWDCSH